MRRLDLPRPGALAILLCLAPAALGAQAAPRSYPAMAPLAAYQSASRDEEIALARSAAPSALSDDATVLAFTTSGYETAVTGRNGFVCVVERAWTDDFSDPEFWNPQVRVPICFNAASARTTLPTYLERTRWVLAGVSRDEMAARTRREVARGGYPVPERESMCYMMSKRGYLNDAVGPAGPHLMFFVAKSEAGRWGANLAGSPINATQGDPEPVTTFYISVAKWSDGTLAHR